MRGPLRTLLLQYGTPMVSAVLAALLTWWLQPLLTSGHFLFFLTAVAIGAWVAGSRGGLLAALLCAVVDGLCLYLAPPAAGFTRPGAWLDLGLFFLASALLSCLVVMLRAAGSEGRRLADEMRERIRRIAEADRCKDEFLAVRGRQRLDRTRPVRDARRIRPPGVP